jgi:hypothetical protein
LDSSSAYSSRIVQDRESSICFVMQRRVMGAPRYDPSMRMESMLHDAAAPSSLADNPWFAVGLPLGIAVIGLAGTIVVLVVQTRTRAREIRDDRAAAVAREKRDREEDLRRERTDAYEDIIAEVARYAEAMNATTRGKLPGEHISYPSQAQLRRALGKLTTRMGDPELFELCLASLQYGVKLPAEQFVGVLGTIQERLDFWFVGKRSLEDTKAALTSDIAHYATGKMPPAEGPLPPGAAEVFGPRFD